MAATHNPISLGEQVVSPHVAGDLIFALREITFSGTYPTGGETLDFTSTIKRGSGIGKTIMVIPEGKAGYEFEWDRANSKLKVNTTAATELAAAAYPAGLTAGTLRVLVIGR